MGSLVRKWVGQPIPREEDINLLNGAGKYLDDINLDGQLYMKVVRSPIARAAVESIDILEASQLSGVVAVYSASDFKGLFVSPVAMAGPGAVLRDAPIKLIADEKVNYVGEPVAVVIALSKASAEDAAELVEVEYESLPVVVDPHESLQGDVLLHDHLDDNVLLSWSKQSDDFEEAMASATTIVESFFELPRIVAAPMEPRGCIIDYDLNADSCTVWASSQDPHRPKAQLAHAFGLPNERVRVIIPEVGGAFGSKGGAPQEYILACAASKKLGRPIKWVEDRSENFVGAYQGRGISASVRLGLDDSGKFVAIEADLLADLGAYLFPSTPIAPVTASVLLTGAYKIPSAKVTMKGVATNKVPAGPYRGAGRPEACFFIERIVDLAAGQIGIDAVALRIKNLISKDDFPYQTPLGPIYDSGNYEPTLKRATELMEQSLLSDNCHKEGWVSGIGISMSVEPAGSGFWESGSIKVFGDGRIEATSGSSSHGQGHKTSFAQIVADELGVDMTSISLKQGDSEYGEGVGTFGSRSLLLGGEALIVASKEIKSMASKWASSYFEAAIEDLVWDGDRIHVQGSPTSQLTLFEIANQMEDSEEHLSLAAKARSKIPGPVFPFAAYGAHVAMELSTGIIEVKRMVGIDDAGVIVNPLLAEGQISGATLQGIGAALLEEMIYDDAGNPLTSSFVDYLIPGSMESDFFSQNEFMSTPTPFTTLGAKGVGESGTVGAVPAVANAVSACLAKAGFTGNVNPPYSPEKLWKALYKDRNQAMVDRSN